MQYYSKHADHDQSSHGNWANGVRWNPPQKGKTSWEWADVLDIDEKKLRAAVTPKLEIVPGSLKVNPRTKSPDTGFTKGESFRFQARAKGKDYFFEVHRSNVNGKLAPGSGSITVGFKPFSGFRDRIAGNMIWGINRPNEVTKIQVAKPDQRRGLATAMLQAARLIDPDLKHSTDLSEAGAAWAAVVKRDRVAKLLKSMEAR